MQNTSTFKCTRCNGAGRISAFANVIGGTCFQCKGSGVQRTKPRKPTPLWAVFGPHTGTGEMLRLYNVKAPTKVKAIEAARRTYEHASADWRQTYSLITTEAMKVADMKDPTAITWKEAAA